jgi:hypothetical protein
MYGYFMQGSGIGSVMLEGSFYSGKHATTQNISKNWFT